MEAFSVDKLAQLLDLKLDAGIRKALEVAYLLSTMVEEGRPLRFAFLWSPYVRYNPERKLKEAARGGEAIRRLCLASDPTENVWRFEYDAENDDITVTGLANYPFEPFVLPPFDDFLIEVDGVGSVSIRVRGKRAKYSNCRHFKPNADEVLPALIPEGVAEAVAQSGFTRTGNGLFIPWSRGYLPLDTGNYNASRDKFEATMREVAQAVVPLTLLIMLRRMRDLHHGGCVVLTNSENPWVGIFAKCNALGRSLKGSSEEYGYNWALLGYVRVRTHLLMLERDGTLILADLAGKTKDEAESNLRDIHLSMHDRQTQRYAELWAQLSSVDGIVVMDRMLEPVIFGGLINLPPDFKEIPDKGARHRAGAYCATLIPGSVAIVVSQDGAVTAYRKPVEGGPIVETKLLF